jgi:hypothetical protein
MAVPLRRSKSLAVLVQTSNKMAVPLLRSKNLAVLVLWSHIFGVLVLGSNSYACFADIKLCFAGMKVKLIGCAGIKNQYLVCAMNIEAKL